MSDTKFKRKDYMYSIGEKFVDNNRNIEIIGRYEKIRVRSDTSKHYQKIYVCKCYKCGANDAVIEQSHLKSGRGCPVCHGKQISVGVNDIPTTATWMIPYFLDGEEEARQYTCQSGKKLYFKCPDCNRISKNQITINHLYNRKSIGCICQDGISYPEKFMYNLLQQLDINFVFQFSEKWCKQYRYDFYLPDYKCIIETHGLQHYELCSFNKNDIKRLNNQRDIDQNKRGLAMQNGIHNYFEIDCRFSNKNHIINSIIKCDVLNIFPSKNINWEACALFATSNLLKSVCIYYENHKNESTADIARRFNINSCTVSRYLNKGTDMGFCVYDTKNKKRRKLKKIKIVKEDGKYEIYDSAQKLQDESLEKYGVKLLRDNVWRVCNKKKLSYKGFYFEFV